MPNFTHSGKKNPGDQVTCAGGASPVAPTTDTITVHGYVKNIAEAVRRGLIRTVSTSGNNTTYQLQVNPDKLNQ